MTVASLRAITLATHDMARAVAFYRSLGFAPTYGGADAPFTTLKSGSAYLNLTLQPPDRRWSWWGRVVFHVPSVDDLFAVAVGAGLQPDTEPADAVWGERFFHLTDPDGHELSFAQPL
ncbi:MAG: VOC family protein [Planctomycetota bacterium]